VAEVTLRSVRKVYPNGFVAIADASFEIHDGELLVLVGPSGCGKSTLLRMIAGLEEVSSGSIFIGERDVTHLEPRDRDIAMVFQSYALYPHMTVERNLGFALKMVGTPVATIDNAVKEAAAKVGIGHLLSRTPGQLSGGQQQRCALARAIVRQPRLFLLDEPLSNLDAKLRLETRIELHSLQRALGATTVYVTHDQEEAMTLADRLAVFHDGRIVQVGTPRDVFTTPQTVDALMKLDLPAGVDVEIKAFGKEHGK
jgi:ABC-type sugar transport system ATPase subunit